MPQMIKEKTNSGFRSLEESVRVALKYICKKSILMKGDHILTEVLVTALTVGLFCMHGITGQECH